MRLKAAGLVFTIAVAGAVVVFLFDVLLAAFDPQRIVIEQHNGRVR